MKMLIIAAIVSPIFGVSYFTEKTQGPIPEKSCQEWAERFNKTAWSTASAYCIDYKNEEEKK